MAFDTGEVLSTKQEQASAKLATSARVAAEPVGNAVPKVFNWLDYLIDISSVNSEGVRSINVNGSDIIPVPPINPTSSEESVNLDALPVKHSLFYDDMRTGLNTRDKWWVVSVNNETGTPTYTFLLPRSINTPVPNLHGWSATWNKDTETLAVVIYDSDTRNNYPFVFQAKTAIKFPAAGGTFGIFGGFYEPQLSTGTATMSYEIKLPAIDDVVPVSEWSIDQFQLPGNTGLNPSMIGLDMDVYQQPTFRVRNGKGGGIVFGFTIDGHFYPAHLISAQNFGVSGVDQLGNLNLFARRVCERRADGNDIRVEVGFSDSFMGYSGTASGALFVSRALLSTNANATYKIKETDVFTTSATSNNLQQVPFTADCVGDISNDASPYPIYTPVQGTGEGVEILALRPTPNFNGTTRYNKSTFYPTKLDVHVKGDVETDAVLLQVWVNGKSPGGNVYFPIQPESAIDKSITVGNIPSGQQVGVKLGSILVGVGQRASLDIPFLFSSTKIDLDIGGQLVGNFDRITVVAVGEQTSSASTAVSVVLSGIEEY